MLKDNMLDALEMFNIFTDNEEENKISDEGLEQLKAIFHSVPDEDRVEVFTIFLTLLREDGYEYDVKQFEAA